MPDSLLEDAPTWIALTAEVAHLNGRRIRLTLPSGQFRVVETDLVHADPSGLMAGKVKVELWDAARIGGEWGDFNPRSIPQNDMSARWSKFLNPRALGLIRRCHEPVNGEYFQLDLPVEDQSRLFS
jgi:hypothetical protein